MIKLIIYFRIKEKGIRTNIDLSDKTPGWKFSEQEKLGIPVRIEIGPRDLENNEVIVVRRDNHEKIKVSIDSLCDRLPQILETIQKDMYNRAKEFLDSHIDSATTMDEMIDKFNKNVVLLRLCGVAMRIVKMKLNIELVVLVVDAFHLMRSI